ncbi:hypothetical protein Tco_1044195 [Tanacetum coccineum]|uniref:Uncharacterized protein n=1 Tax=Tanacetum coccineum TaxID=301880 RepID=A0ABQ5GPW0_9ASTR
MINQLHNISTIFDSYTNPSNSYIHAPSSPPPQQIHLPSHAQVKFHSDVFVVESLRGVCLEGAEDVRSIIHFLSRTNQKLRDDQKRMKNVFEVRSGRWCKNPIENQGAVEKTSMSILKEDTEVDPIEKLRLIWSCCIYDGDDVRDHVEIDPKDVRDDTEEYEADTSAGDTVEVGIDPMSAPMVEEEIVEPAGEDSSDSSGTRDGIVRSFEDMPIDLDDAVHDFYHHMSEVRIDRIVRIETVQRRLEADQLIARGERAGMIERIESLRLENFKVRAMLDIERDRVNSLRLHMSLSQEEFRQVRRDDTRGRFRRLESYVKRRLGFRP